MQIRRGLDEKHRRAAAEIYWRAFQNKLGVILGDDARAIRYFEQVIVAEQALCALDGDKLIGLAGFDSGDGGVIGGGFGEIFAVYPWSAWWRALALSVFERAVPALTLMLDGIAVAPEARGRGVGTALLVALDDIAREHGKTRLALDVIDSNPRAKSLYERHGYQTQFVHETGLLAPLLGFRSSVRMIKEL